MPSRPALAGPGDAWAQVPPRPAPAASRGRGFARWLRPLRRLWSRRRSWDELGRELEQLDGAQDAGVHEAEARAARLGERYSWHLKQQGAVRAELLELRTTLAQLHLRAGRYHDAREEQERFWRDYRRARPARGAEPSGYVPARPIDVELALAQAAARRGARRDAVAHAYRALALGPAGSEQRGVAVRVVLDAGERDLRAWQACLEFASSCGREEQAALPEQVVEFLRDYTSAEPGSHAGARAEAVQRLRALNLAAPWLDWPLVRLAEHDLELGALEPARAKLEVVEAAADEQWSPRAVFLLGQVAFFQDRYEAAERYFARAVETGVDVAGVHEFMGVTKAHVGAFDAALEHLDKALAGRPDDDYLRLQRANVLLCQGQVDGAEALFDGLVARAEVAGDARLGLAQCAELRGDAARAKDLYEQILVQRPRDTAARFARAVLLASEGRRAQALEQLQQVHRDEPQHVPARAELGVLLVQEALAGGAHGLLEGLEHLLACEAARAADERVTYWLGRALAARGEYRQCLERWLPLLERHPSPALRAQVDDVRALEAVHAARAGRLEAALRDLEALGPRRAQDTQVRELIAGIRVVLAQRAMLAGRSREAGELVASVLSLDPRHPRAHLLRALLARGANGVARPGTGEAPPVEDALLKLAQWLSGRESLLGADGAACLWDAVAREELPSELAARVDLACIDLLGRLVRARRAGEPVAAGDVTRVLEQVARLGAALPFSAEQLARLLADLVLAAGADAGVARSLERLVDDGAGKCLSMTRALVRIAGGTLDGVAELVREMGRGPGTELSGYLAQALGHCAMRELQQVAREPGRLRQARAFLEQAAGLYGGAS